MPESKRRTHTVVVEQGEYCALPETTKHVVIGPGKVEITRYANGRLDAQIVEGRSSPAELAVKRNLKRVPWEL